METIKQELRKILDTMKVPAMRKETLDLHNLKWLGRNLAFQNRGHESFGVAKHLICTLITMEGEKPFFIG